MKTKLLPLLLAALAAFGLAIVTGHAQAPISDLPSSISPAAPEAQNLILGLFLSLAAQYPGLATIITVLGSMRLWAKPLFAAVHAVIDATPSKYDDGLWARAYGFFTDNKIGRALAWLLDYAGSIKLPPKSS